MRRIQSTIEWKTNLTARLTSRVGDANIRTDNEFNWNGPTRL
jgi:hypothetical protein